MKIRKKSMLTGVDHVMDLPISKEKLEYWNNSQSTWRAHIQDVFPELSADQREFLMTGITSQEWNNVFGDEE